MYCKYCGKLIDADCRYCTHCGSALTAEPAVPPAPQPLPNCITLSPEEPANKGSHLVPLLIMLAMSIMGLLVFCATGG